MKINIKDNKIIVDLPITTPTGEVRVKRPLEGFAPEPVACRSKDIDENDYLEWQIGYDTDNLNEPSIIKKPPIQKKKGTRYGYELTRLIIEGKKLGLITEEEIAELKDLISADFNGVQEAERIELKQISNSTPDIGEKFGFTRHQLITPDYIKKGTKYSVEIKISHKQRAVGNQSMIFLNLPVRFCTARDGSPIFGRIAEIKEEIQYRIDSTNRKLIFDTTLAFVVGSKAHRNDIGLIFRTLGI
ncbi:R.Pab1 family restriction endonuclease [bacterium]|nr:R.Pab1 family restriction endonuclease [bacterium]